MCQCDQGFGLLNTLLQDTPRGETQEDKSRQTSGKKVWLGQDLTEEGETEATATGWG